MEQRRREELYGSESRGPDSSVTLEEYIADYLEASRQNPDHAFSVRLWTKTNRRYIPGFSLALLADLRARGIDRAKILHERIVLMKMSHSDHHFPSSPARPPRYAIMFRDGSLRMRAAQGFCSKSAAKGFIDEVLRYLPDEELTWKSPTSMAVGEVLLIECPELEELMEHGSSIEMPYPYTAWAAGIAGRAPERMIHDVPEEAPRKRRKERRERTGEPSVPDAVKTRQKRGGPPGSFDASSLAEEFGLAPGKVRSILRSANVAKPYSWTEGEELDRIRSIIKKGTKEVKL